MNPVFSAKWMYPLAIMAMCAALSTGLSASGSYMPRPPQPPAKAIEDSAKYEFGKAIFAGHIPLNPQATSDKGAQRARLADLQEKLPARVKKHGRTVQFGRQTLQCGIPGARVLSQDPVQDRLNRP